MRRVTGVLITTAALAIATLTVGAPPAVRVPPAPSFATVEAAAADGGAVALHPAIYAGGIGPGHPIEVADTEVRTGSYTVRLMVAGRFASLTGADLTCEVVESRSGIALTPPVAVRLGPGAEWATTRADVPLALPAMSLAANCATAANSFGRLEVVRATLIADPLD